MEAPTKEALKKLNETRLAGVPKWTKNNASFGSGLGNGFGQFPVEFNPRVHGPYAPWRYYGKRKFDLQQKWFREPKLFDLLHFNIL